MLSRTVGSSSKFTEMTGNTNLSSGIFPNLPEIRVSKSEIDLLRIFETVHSGNLRQSKSNLGGLFFFF